ncbi:MAG: HIT domain-containing protein [candidate division Zixibacteria bacterium]|nr:HIT domain-containing protein [candidate division Zixibacteria bacterium]
MADKMIWAPWRSAFILRTREKGCIFCNRLKMKDSEENLIIYRGHRNIVILNKFPYNSGHSMVVPKRHVGRIEKLTTEESIEFFELVRQTVVVIKKALCPDSLNLGMNLGRSSGAGVPGHVHMHIVPRWQGDTNFMPVIGKTSVVSIPLEPVYEALKKEFGKL